MRRSATNSSKIAAPAKAEGHGRKASRLSDLVDEIEHAEEDGFISERFILRKEWTLEDACLLGLNPLSSRRSPWDYVRGRIPIYEVKGEGFYQEIQTGIINKAIAHRFLNSDTLVEPRSFLAWLVADSPVSGRIVSKKGEPIEVEEYRSVSDVLQNWQPSDLSFSEADSQDLPVLARLVQLHPAIRKLADEAEASQQPQITEASDFSPLRGCAKEIAKAIHTKPGILGKEIALIVECTEEHVRRVIRKELKPKGYCNERPGYHPPRVT